MNRRRLREQIFKLLFRIEFNSEEEMEEQCELFFDDVDIVYEEKDEKFIKAKFDDIVAHLGEIDKIIEDNAKGWTIDRIGKVELTVIRLAIYEIRFDEEVPTQVAINEAVELAKVFGPDKSSSFVNAVLAKLA